jgi:transcription elongation factor SPT5
MSTANLHGQHFDDSEDEDDNFNPAPADLSDDENTEDAPNAQIRGETARRKQAVDDEGQDSSPVRNNAKNRGSADDEDDNGEDEEGEGEDTAGVANDDEDEEEEEEDDEEEEITVS